VTRPSLESTPFLSLNCFVLGDDPDRTFTVEIPKNKNVDILKDRIKEKRAPQFDHIIASYLDLWQVSFPIDDLHSKNPPTVGPKMRSNRLLSDSFLSELDINHIHVVVRPPDQGKYDIDSASMLLSIPSRRTLS
jgi:Crinkler effector protein N-terminal domain